MDDTIQFTGLEIKVQTSPYKRPVTIHDHLSTENRSGLCSHAAIQYILELDTAELQCFCMLSMGSARTPGQL